MAAGHNPTKKYPQHHERFEIYNSVAKLSQAYSTRPKLLLSFSRALCTRHLYLWNRRPAMDHQQEQHVCQ